RHVATDGRRSLRVTLVHPQQPRHAEVVGVLVLALARESEPHQLRQQILSRLAVVPLASTDLQIAAGLVHECLGQLVIGAGEAEVQLHARAGAGVAARQVVVMGDGTAALKEGRADGGDDRALAGLLRSEQDIEAGSKARDLDGGLEAAELLEADALEVEVLAHRVTPAARRAISSVARISRASRDTWACAGSVESCPCCSSSNTSAT